MGLVRGHHMDHENCFELKMRIDSLPAAADEQFNLLLLRRRRRPPPTLNNANSH
jgi:hypothetical protein